MNELKFDEFFKDNFDTTGIEDNIYNQLEKTIARGIDINLAKTPLVDILTGYTRYKILELEVERLHSIIKEVRDFIDERKYDFCDEHEMKDEDGKKILEILDKENIE